MALHYLPNGIGGALGDSLVTSAPLIVSGNIWYVDSATGTDAASPAGRNREKPLATLAQAHTNAADHDIIVFLSGHAETLTVGQAITKRIVLVGEGSSGGLPTVKFTINAGAQSLFDVSVSAVEIRNLWIEENAQANSVAKVFLSGGTADGFRMRGCYIEANGNDDAAALSISVGTNNVLIENCTFISTSTATSAQPHSAIKTVGSLSDLRLQGVIISDGTVGWSNHYGLDLSADASERLRVEELSLLLGADMALHASWSGFVGPYTSTGGGKVSVV